MVAVALLAVPAVFLGVSRLPEPWPTVGSILHWLVWLGFLSEAAVLLAVSDDRAGWVRRHKLTVFVVIVSSPLVPLAVALVQGLRGAPALQLLKLSKSAKLARAGQTAKSAKLLKLARSLVGGKRLLRLTRLWRVTRVLRRRLGLRGVRLAALLALFALLVLGSSALLVEPERYTTPAHGAWRLLWSGWEQTARVAPLERAALLAAFLVFVAILAWSYRARGAAQGKFTALRRTR